MNDVPISYSSEFVIDPDEAFRRLWTELAWVQRDQTPRREYHWNTFGIPYTYGRGAGERTYESQPYHEVIASIQCDIEAVTGTRFDVCFLNGYRDGSDQLGWHADDSPEMDDKRPIAIVSLGARREIYFAPAITVEGKIKPDTSNKAVVRFREFMFDEAGDAGYALPSNSKKFGEQLWSSGESYVSWPCRLVVGPILFKA